MGMEAINGEAVTLFLLSGPFHSLTPVEPEGVQGRACGRPGAGDALPRQRNLPQQTLPKAHLFLCSGLGSVQRPHSDGEERNQAEQSPTDPHANAAPSTLRGECLSSPAQMCLHCREVPVTLRPVPGSACAACIDGGWGGLCLLEACACPLSVPPCRGGEGSLPLAFRSRATSACGSVLLPPGWGGGRSALLSDGFILTSLFLAACFSFSDRFHADGIPAQPLPYSQAPVPHRTGPHAHGHAER